MDINRGIRAGAHRRESTPPVVPVNNAAIEQAKEAPRVVPEAITDGTIDEKPPITESSDALLPEATAPAAPAVQDIEAANSQRADEVATMLRQQLNGCGIALDEEQMRALALTIMHGGDNGLFVTLGIAQVMARTAAATAMAPQAADFGLDEEQAAQILAQLASAPEQAEQIVRPMMTDADFLPIADDRLDVMRMLAGQSSSSQFAGFFGLPGPIVATSERALLSHIANGAIHESAKDRFLESERTIEETTALLLEQRDLGNLDAVEELKTTIAQTTERARAIELALQRHSSLLPQLFDAFGSAVV